MIQIDRNNNVLVGLDLYTVAGRHQSGLVEAIIQEQINFWKSNPYFLSASIHQSLDGVRVFRPFPGKNIPPFIDGSSYAALVLPF